MSKYVRDITASFHNNNHTKIKNVCKIKSSDYKIITNTPDANGIITIKNKLPGVYMIIINKESYLFNLNDAIIGNDCIVIKDIYTSYLIIDGKKRYINLYRGSDLTIEDGSYVIPNTVNNVFDMISFGGETYLTYANESQKQSPYNPAKITSISTINISTSDGNTKSCKVDIRLKNNIKKLPSGVNDLFVIDPLHKRAYILFRIGRMILTGNENWQTVIENNKYCIYFMKSSLVNIGEDDSSINCNYFPTMTYSKMENDIISTYGISNSNDPENTGFYIRIPTDLLGIPSVDTFKKYIRNCLSNEPIIIEYLLKDMKYKSVLLDDYSIRQFYPKTILSIKQNLSTVCFCKTVHYDYTEVKPSVL